MKTINHGIPCNECGSTDDWICECQIGPEKSLIWNQFNYEIDVCNEIRDELVWIAGYTQLYCEESGRPDGKLEFVAIAILDYYEQDDYPHFDILLSDRQIGSLTDDDWITHYAFFDFPKQLKDEQ